MHIGGNGLLRAIISYLRKRNTNFKLAPSTVLTLAGGFVIVPCVITLARAGGGSRQIEVSVTRERGYYANTIPAIGQNSEVIRYATIIRGSQRGTGCYA